VPHTEAPWYHTVQQHHYTKVYPSPQALFVELQAARCSGWQLTSLVQQHARLVTTFTRHHRGGEADSSLPSEKTW
jgi:neutral trehalase